MQIIQSEQVFINYKDQSAQFIDLRETDAYNGWPLRGEIRGGHIPGAKSLPLKWTKYMDWIEVVRSKQILPEQTLILYAYPDQDHELAARLFAKAGYKKLYFYEDFFLEWIPNQEYPIENLKRWKNLVPASWLKELIENGTAPDFDVKNFKILHAHYRNREAYLSGHIPGAIDVDTLELEAPETWNRRSPDELKKNIEAMGITADTTVILYGKFMFPDNKDEFPGSAAGHIGAIRSAAILMYAGVKDVKVLNGGFQSWIDENYPVEMTDNPRNPVADFGCLIPARPELFVDTPEAKSMLAADDADLVCVRSWPEYLGEVSGYNYIEKKGRIQGAIFGNCGSDAYHMENYRNVDHSIREAQEVRAIWEEVEIIPKKHLAFYCGTGWRGSEAFYNAWLMGWPKVSVYDGGWFEWSNDPENPYETGLPK